MRNLKRALSFALAAIMLIGLMVVGAGAAYKDFTDSDEIQHTEAVKTLTTLNVIAGKEDGSYYDPTGTLTRAEMAKLVTYVLNGGTEPVLNIKATPTYSDIDNHWAEAYIEYCTSQGIIAGDGAGKFNPEGTLTGSQAAKMILVAMGYSANVFGFTGNNWEINVNREANGAGLYDDLSGLDPSKPVSRDDAAQLVYNAILAGTMELTWNQNMETGEVTQVYNLNKNKTLFNDKFDGTIYEGVLTTSGQYSLDNRGAKDRVEIASVLKVDNLTPETATTFTAKAEDNDLTNLVGQYVKALYNEKTEKVYGVYPVDAKNNVVIETTRDKVTIDNGKLKVDGTKYNFETAGGVYLDGSYNALISALPTTAPAMGDKVTVISNNGDEKIDLVLIETIAVAKVNYVGTDSFSITSLAGARSQGADGLGTYTAANQKFEDVNAPEDLAKDDYVLITEDYYTQTDTYEVITPDTATVGGTKDGQWMLDDAWYKVYTGDTTDTLTAAVKGGDTVEFIAYGGIVYYAKRTSGVATIDNIALVVTADKTGGSGQISTGTEKAVLLKADGTKATVETVDIDGDQQDVTGLVGKLVSYQTTSSGKYILTAISSAAGTDYDSYISSTVKDSAGSNTGSIAKVNTTDIADDAVVFVMRYKTATNAANAENDAKVLTGKEAKALATGTYDGTTVQALVSNVNGFGYVKVMTLFNDAADQPLPNTFDGTEYGYLVADAYQTYDSATTTWYRNYNIWNGSETIVVKEDANGLPANMKAGAVISYNLSGEGIVKDVKLVNPVLTQVTGYDADAKKMAVYATGLNATKITEDTVIFYVNSETKTGVAGGTISIADDTSADGSITDADQANVRVLASTADGRTDEWAFILVDVNNKMAAGPVRSYAAGDAAVDTVAEINTLLAQGNDIAISGNVTLGTTAIDVPAGRSLTVTGNLENTSMAMTVDGTLNVTGTLTATSVTLNDADASLNVTGATTASVVVTNGSAELAAVTGNVSASNASTVKAGAITGTLTLSGTAKAEVASVSNTITDAAGTELTITGNSGSIGFASDTINGKVSYTDATGAVTLTATTTTIAATAEVTVAGDWTGASNKAVTLNGKLTVNGDITTDATSGSITLGADAVLTVNGKLDTSAQVISTNAGATVIFGNESILSGVGTNFKKVGGSDNITTTSTDYQGKTFEYVAGGTNAFVAQS